MHAEILERRQGERRSGGFEAGMRKLGASGRSVTILDISRSGCAFEPAGFLTPDQRIFVRLPGLESWAARIVWVQEGRAGCKFDRPFHSAVIERLLAPR